MTPTVVTRWDGVFLVDGPTLLREVRIPADETTLVDRASARRGGSLIPEERSLLALRGGTPWNTRDRRLVGEGVVFDPKAPGTVSTPADDRVRRAMILRVAEASLAAAWDPSIHIEEATRAVRDLDRAANLLGERLASWVGRDAPDLGADEAGRAARIAIEGGTQERLGPPDPRLTETRRRLGLLYEELRRTREALDVAITTSLPGRAPNLARLLGPELAAALVAHAGGLDRLARLPSSTIQVLGAEKAFFEHLRGRAPPPRHGLLFLHPSIQSAPRSARGKLARTLAGKTAIAARLDRAGAAIDPSLRAAFDRREAELKARRSGSSPGRSRPRSGSPLDAAAEHR